MIPYILLQIVVLPVIASIFIFLTRYKIGKKAGWIAGITLLYTTALLSLVGIRVYQGEIIFLLNTLRRTQNRADIRRSRQKNMAHVLHKVLHPIFLLFHRVHGHCLLYKSYNDVFLHGTTDHHPALLYNGSIRLFRLHRAL